MAPNCRRPRSHLMTDTIRTGGCACGQVRLTLTGQPRRVGLCHCMTCRKSHGAAYNPFAVFERRQVRMTGDTAAWESSPGYVRRFCPVCGSSVMFEDVTGGEEVEVSLGSLDEPRQFTPSYELWVKRRETWQAALPVEQWDEDRRA